LAQQYLKDAIKGKSKTQDYYFKGMKLLNPEDVGPETERVKGIPLELRALGTKIFSEANDWTKKALNLLAESRRWHGTENVDVSMNQATASSVVELPDRLRIARPAGVHAPAER